MGWFWCVDFHVIHVTLSKTWDQAGARVCLRCVMIEVDCDMDSH